MIAGYLFDSIVFPIVFFFLLFVFAKSALLYVFEDHRELSYRKEIRDVLAMLESSKPGAEGHRHYRSEPTRRTPPRQRIYRRYRDKTR